MTKNYSKAMVNYNPANVSHDIFDVYKHKFTLFYN